MTEFEKQPESSLEKPAPLHDPSVNPAAKALAMLTAVRERVMAMPAGKRTWLMAGALFAASVLAVTTWYAGRTQWRPLFTGLEQKDVQQVSQELSSAGIAYRATPDGGGIDVPAEQLDKARMEVAAKGMPQTGRLGFELFDKPNWVGSEFDERVNYQRALEGELEHTIMTLGSVRSARVHLVLPEKSLFSSQDRPAKASVVLKLKRSSLSDEQIEAIRSLVAGAVTDLLPENVALVDADGRVSFKSRSQSSLEADAEQAMETKLVAMLEPLAGRDNVRATVNVSYEEGTEDRTDEVYDPTQSAALTLQKSEQVQTQAVRAAGVPGTASNSPSGAPSGAVQGSQAAAAPGTPPLLQREALPVYPQQGRGGEQSLHQENGTYGVTKHVIHASLVPGRLRRVTVAVLVNDRSGVEGAGKLEHKVWKPRSADEMRRLEQLAQAAVGYDAHRGDQVVVENVSFSANGPEVKAPLAQQTMEQLRALAQTQPGLARTVMIGILGLMLMVFILRPLTRQVAGALQEPAREQAALLVQSSVAVPDEPSLIDPVPVPASLPERVLTKEQLQQRSVYEQISEHIRRDPAQSTRVLEAWIGTAEEVEA